MNDEQQITLCFKTATTIKEYHVKYKTELILRTVVNLSPEV
jgi:hypothetical protein